MLLLQESPGMGRASALNRRCREPRQNISDFYANVMGLLRFQLCPSRPLDVFGRSQVISHQPISVLSRASASPLPRAAVSAEERI